MSTFRITLLTLWLSLTLIALATASAMAQPLSGLGAAPDAATAAASGVPLR
jgi:hypothetical protein